MWEINTQKETCMRPLLAVDYLLYGKLFTRKLLSVYIQIIVCHCKYGGWDQSDHHYEPEQNTQTSLFHFIVPPLE